MKTLLILALVALAWPAFAQAPATKPETRIALKGGTLIDGRPGSVVRNSVVLLRGERIEAVGTLGTLEVPEGYHVVSTEGMTVLPGLWDMHTHLQYSAHSDLNAWNTGGLFCGCWYDCQRWHQRQQSVCGQLGTALERARRGSAAAVWLCH